MILRSKILELKRILYNRQIWQTYLSKMSVTVCRNFSETDLTNFIQHVHILSAYQMYLHVISEADITQISTDFKEFRKNY